MVPLIKKEPDDIASSGSFYNRNNQASQIFAHDADPCLAGALGQSRTAAFGSGGQRPIHWTTSAFQNAIYYSTGKLVCLTCIFSLITQTSHMKNMSFSHNHTALSNKHYQAADFCSALRIYSGSLLTKSCAITCSCLSVAWNTVLILASITSCKIIMDCWNVTSAISFTIR